MRYIIKLADIVFGVFNRHILRYYAANKIKKVYLNERACEYGFTLQHLSKNQILNVLDVGTGTNAFSATLTHCGYNVTASDLMGSYWDVAFRNRHIYVVKDDITKSKFASNSFDAVTCISTLEHIKDYDTALKNMVRILKADGILIISFPYSYDQFCSNVYDLDTADKISKTLPYIARSFCDEQIEQWCRKFDLDIMDKKYIKGWQGKFWRSGERIVFPYEVSDKTQANCICLALKKSSV